MESLSKWLKQTPLPAKADPAEAARKVRSLMAHPQLEKWRDRHPDVTDDDLRLNINRVHLYLKEYDHCSACPGLSRCPNDMQGHYTRLGAESVPSGGYHLADYKVPCKKWISHRNQESVHKRIRSFYVDERALKEGYSPQEIVSKDLERAKAVEKVIDYVVQTRENGLQANGQYLVGGFGTGKTFLMCYMLHELAKDGFSGVIVYMPDFMEDLKASFQEPGRLKDTIEMLKETDLLVFDDIGAENLNAWARDHVLGTILNYRMNRKPTFYTSNYSLDALGKHLSFTNRDGEDEFKGFRLMDRIRPFVDVVHVKGQNQRGSL